jgi:transcriptional regulator GlxA family with amidase domain
MLYLVRGQGRFIDANDNVTNLKSGTRLDRHPNMPHTIERHPDGQWVEFFITLSPTLHQSFCELGLLDPHRVISHAPMTTSLLKTCVQLVDQMLDAAITPTTTVQHLAHLLAQLDDRSRNLNDPLNQSDQLQRAAHLLTDIMHQHMPLPAIAQQIGMTYETFRKHFTRHFGINPQQYRITQRIRQAQHQLLETDIRIEDLARSLGYNDVFCFSRQFKCVCGMSPSHYRQQTLR